MRVRHPRLLPPRGVQHPSRPPRRRRQNLIRQRLPRDGFHSVLVRGSHRACRLLIRRRRVLLRGLRRPGAVYVTRHAVGHAGYLVGVVAGSRLLHRVGLVALTRHHLSFAFSGLVPPPRSLRLLVPVPARPRRTPGRLVRGALVAVEAPVRVEPTVRSPARR